MKDLTGGNIRKHILVFSWPLLVSNVLQLVNLTLNRIWAGKFLGDSALGALSIAAVILVVISSFSMGLTIGTGTVISQYFGAHKTGQLKKAASSAFLLLGACAILATAAIFLFGEWLLHLMHTPEAILTLTNTYLSITSIGFLFLFIQVLVGFMFFAIGDSLTPLIYSGVSVCVNAALDPFLMLGIFPFPRLEVTGAAYSYLISLFVGFVVALYLYQKKAHVLHTSLKDIFRPDWEVTKQILRLGMSSGGKNVATSSGVLVVQVFVNHYGAGPVAAYGAVTSVTNLVLYVSWAIGAGVSVVAGQNMGAHSVDRVRQGLAEGLKICLLYTSVIVVASLLFPRGIMLCFLSSDAHTTIACGAELLQIVAIPLFFLVLMNILDSFFSGVGANFASMIIAVMGIWAWRVAGIFVFRHFFGLEGVWYGLAVSYVLAGATAYGYYLSGRWKDKGIV